VLAERLSASGRDRVLVLEAGGTDRRFWIKLPIGYGRTFADPRQLEIPDARESGPERPHDVLAARPRRRRLELDQRLVYCRGMPVDFDDWRDMGNIGWGWDDVRPYFEKSERRVGPAGPRYTRRCRRARRQGRDALPAPDARAMARGRAELGLP
jgi:choline dehydrogenase